MVLAWTVAIIILVAMIVYALLGGADFGAGVWDLLASGPRARKQRDLVALSIGPVWEANHVWLIVIVVILFTCFPPAFSVLMTALHVPVALALVGILARAASYVFRNYDVLGDKVQARWSLVFSVASIITPILLGVVVGAVSTGRIRVAPEENFRVLTGYFAPWVHPFPFAVGLFTLALFAFLAAVYMTRETADPALQEDFRNRALLAQGAVVVFGVIAAFVSRLGEHEPFHQTLLSGTWSWLFFAAACAAAIVSTALLVTRRYRLGRIVAGAEVTAVVAGWGVAQAPFFIAPDVTIENAVGPSVTLRLIVIILAVGSVTLLPSLYWLYRVFKREPAFEQMRRERTTGEL
ncbi:MAG TPA: cytochrome d ubiquinol oxidase subunit II [Vulgatibacter sp.]|nr:cytochrome d ubiquinol oxidase subunit II [Vulgatibacter sp.]